MKHDKAYYYQLYFNQILPQIAEITTQSKHANKLISNVNKILNI